MAPKAGFWSIGGYEISFRVDGRWYADEEPVENAKIALLFSRHVQPDGTGEGWVIDLGIDRQSVTIEDTALVVTAVRGTARDGFDVTTNDGETSALDCSTLVTGDDNVLYCRVDRGARGSIRARFLRAPYYDLARWVEAGEMGPVIPSRGTRHVISSGD